ncbi:MAG TPA: hypothetical protein VKE88_00560, partial [Candidatus Nanoarchaeia archaeon]|nr:hypothetical protein [Candidatus Nanoarchaeia archaeon]
MLTTDTVQKIEEFVYQKPRSIDEIAKMLKKNWRTADRYIKDIQDEYGTVATTVFREGSRGALKVVYWASVERASKNIFQQELEQHILSGKNKGEFSPFDMYQHVPKDKKTVVVEESK